MINSTPARSAVSAAILMALFLFNVSPARAQSHSLQVTVPFDFYVGDTPMPAGDYEVLAFVNAVRFSNQATHASAAINMLALKKPTEELFSPQLIFNTYGQDHFLAEMWWGGSVGNMPMPSKREVELAKTLRPVRIASRASR
jgi:hypothetical protein